MSNEEIRSEVGINQFSDGNQELYSDYRVNQIQDLTRKDERDTLISEIDTTLQNALKTAYDGSEVVTAIQTKLNELRAK